MDKESVGRRIRSYLVDSGMTYEELAEKLSTDEEQVKAGTVKSWIYGQRGMSLDRAVQIADVFGKSLDDLACRQRKAS